MGMVKNFQQRDVAEALDLLLHMVMLVNAQKTISGEDVTRVKELVQQIKDSR